MEAKELLRSRRSIREYTDKPVAEGTLEEIVELARFAPTGNNVQPWELVTITDEDKLDKIAELNDQPSGFPACIGVFVREEGLYEKDASSLTTYLTLAAAAEDLGSCWVGAYEKDFEDEIKEMLNVPEDLKLFSFVTLGYPAEDPSPEKRSVEDLLNREEF